MAENLKLFNEHSEYESFILTDDFIRPNVSYCKEENEVHYNPSIIFTGYKTGLTTEQDIIAYVKSYVRRPHGDLVNEYTNIYPDCGSLVYIGEGEGGQYWADCWNNVVNKFPGANSDGCGATEGGAGVSYHDGRDEPFWFVTWGGFQAYYYPSDGHVCVNFYDA